MEAKCYRAMRRDGQRHGPRRIAKHPELSGLLPLPACKGMSSESELGLVCLDNLHGRDAYEEKRLARQTHGRDAYEEKRKGREKEDRPKRLSNISWILPEQ